ncbi:MAG: inositol monophosphatase family protein [bacterium]|nr:inositol monophosphatase family protein [bacterium]
MSNIKPDLNHVLATAKKAALLAGDKIAELRRTNNFSVSSKANAYDLVTTADLEAEKIIVDLIKKAYSDHLILSEESYQNLSPDLIKEKNVWIIDPIDGTVNYAHGLLNVCVCIGFAHKGEVLAGVVYAPFLNETFEAIKGQGATLNAQKISCSSIQELKKSVVSTGFPYEREGLFPILLGNVEAILKTCNGIRRAGAAGIDLCWVACGRLEAHFEITLKPWDVAAANLIAREAGAITGFMNGFFNEEDMPKDLRSTNTLVAAPGIYEKLKSIIKGI